MLDKYKVLNARQTILDILDDEGKLLDAELGIARADDPPRLLSRPDISHHPDVLEVVENENLFKFFRFLFKEEPITIDYKWLRAVTRGLFTGVHVDRVYVGGGSQRIHTCWIPLGEISPHLGTLIVVPGSHTCEALAEMRDTYGRGLVGTDGTASGWLTSKPASRDFVEKYGELTWATTDFHPGDVCILDIDLLHMSTTNTTDRLRISCDTRWQPASDPIDERVLPKKTEKE